MTLTPRRGETLRKQLDVPDYRAGVVQALRWLGQSGLTSEDMSAMRVVGHRLIHGGEEVRKPVRIDPATKKILWKHSEEEYIDSRGVCMKDGRIYFYCPEKFLAGFDANVAASGLC